MFLLAPLLYLISLYHTITRVECFPTRREEERALDNDDDDDENRIVGGRPVTQGPTRYKWFAKPALYGGHQWIGCGGSLVAPNYVLTAAHCIKPKFVALRKRPGYMIGALCPVLQPDENCGQQQEWRDAVEFFIHPKYNKFERSYDIALVKLSESSTQPYVDMDTGLISQNYDTENRLWAIGFGDTKFSLTDESPPTILKHARLKFCPNHICNREYEKLSAMYDWLNAPRVTKAMMCASAAKKSACQGDSGGPLYDRQKKTLVGVISWGYRCGEAGYPGVFSRVAKAYDWIQDTICKNHVSPLPEFCGGFTNTPTVAPTISSAPTNMPTVAPTISPVPTNTPTVPSSCGKDTVMLTINVKLDQQPWPISYELHHGGDLLLYRSGFMHVSEQETDDICIHKNEDYKFTIHDMFVNGLCCEYGMGGYELLIDGIAFYTSQYTDGPKEIVWIFVPSVN